MDLLCPRWVDPIRQFPRAKRTGISLKELIHLSTLTRCLPLSSQPPSSVAFPDPFGRRSPGHAAFAALKVSGRRWRIRFPRCWPPSASQTVHAVFPHTAFTKTHSSGTQGKKLTDHGTCQLMNGPSLPPLGRSYPTVSSGEAYGYFT